MLDWCWTDVGLDVQLNTARTVCVVTIAERLRWRRTTTLDQITKVTRTKPPPRTNRRNHHRNTDEHRLYWRRAREDDTTTPTTMTTTILRRGRQHNDDDPRTCVFLPHRWNDEAPYIDCIQLKWLTGVCEINARCDFYTRIDIDPFETPFAMMKL
jgi:hypothetical protein